MTDDKGCDAPEREFHAVVARVEERFRAELDDKARAKLGAKPGSGGGNEGKYEPKMVSTGWWVVLARFGVAMRFGSGKPDIEAGDTLVLIARRLPKEKPSAPLAAGIAPTPPPPPADVRAQLVRLCETATPENTDKAVALLESFDAFAGPTLEPAS